MESLRLASLELEATTDGSNAETYEDLYFSMPSGSKRKPLLPPATVEIIRKFGATIGRDRIGPAGFEICTAPASGIKFVNQTSEWAEAFAEDKVYVSSSHGMHVHTDARDFCAKELHKLMMAFRSVQPALFRMVPRDRRRPIDDGGPCARIRYTPEVVAALLRLDGLGKPKGVSEFLKTRLLPTGERNPFVADRHVGCNIALSFAQHRTVEWRLPPGSVKASDMLGWARTFVKLMDWVAEMDIVEAMALVRRGWNGNSSTRHLKKVLASDNCSKFIEEKQKENAD